uniref:Lin-54 DREAM MuvB core complex component n=1 Tax=Amphiprion percula TaxID=161767 RepID=A0A3P8S2Y9_AMPPE
MDVVSPELNSLLPDEIMDTEAIEDLPISISSTSSPILTLKPTLATSTATTQTTDSVTGTSVTTSGLQKLTAPFTISAANHQIILNKVASSQATEAAKSAGTPPQVIKQEGQKLLVTAIGKSGQPIVLQLPHTGNKPGISQTAADTKSPAPQFKVVTIGGRSDLKPVVGSVGNQVTTLQAQQLKTVQVTLTELYVSSVFKQMNINVRLNIIATADVLLLAKRLHKVLKS